MTLHCVATGNAQTIRPGWHRDPTHRTTPSTPPQYTPLDELMMRKGPPTPPLLSLTRFGEGVGEFKETTRVHAGEKA